MTLIGLSPEDRLKATKAYPCMLVGTPNTGKSSAVEFLSPEEKKETIILDLENKGLPEDDNDLYRTVIRLKPAGLIVPEKSHLYQDKGNIKYKSVTELFIYLRAAINHKAVSRIVIDSFTALATNVEAHCVSVHNGFTQWVTYNAQLAEFFTLIKEECRNIGCLLYVIAHYVPARDTKDKESENFAKVAGNKWFRLVESQMSSVVMAEDFKFLADNADVYNSTRVPRSLSPMETNENSMVELETLLCNIGKPTSTEK